MVVEVDSSGCFSDVSDRGEGGCGSGNILPGGCLVIVMLLVMEVKEVLVLGFSYIIAVRVIPGCSCVLATTRLAVVIRVSAKSEARALNHKVNHHEKEPPRLLHM